MRAAAAHSASMDIPDLWRETDPLAEALQGLRMEGVFYCRSDFTAPWALRLPPLPGCLLFHVVTAGRCWLDIPGEPTRLLQLGDLVLVPCSAGAGASAQGHRLSSATGVPAVDLFDIPREVSSGCYEAIRYGAGGEATQMMCGAIRFEQPAARHLVSLLPRVLHIESWRPPHPEWMHQTLRFMAAEAQQLRPGGEAVLTRLADVLVIQALRAWMEQAPAGGGGWLGALKDRHIGRALARLHREPARAWTLAGLAEAACMSRSAFAARFTALVGVPPMQYLAQWRMQLAHGELQAGQASVGELCQRLGYRSEAAFSRAFKRCIGLPPGTVRRQGAGR